MRLNESKWRTLRIGVGSDTAINTALDQVEADAATTNLLEGFNFTPRVTGSFRHTNLFGQLIRFDAAASAGYTYTFGTGETVAETLVRPDYSVRATLLYPRMLGQTIDLELQAVAIEDEQQGLDYRRLEADMAAIYQATRRWQLRLGPHIEEFCFLFDNITLLQTGGTCPDSTEQSDTTRQVMEELFGQGFANPFLVTSLDGRLTYDRRIRNSDTASPHRGLYGAGGLRLGLPLVDNSSSFVGLDGDGRWYLPLRLRSQSKYDLVLALALRGQLLLPYNGDQVPYPEKAFLGGSTSLRGFRSQQVGPYRSACAEYASASDTATEGTCLTYYNQSQGGTLAIQPSMELRYPWAYGITWATFVDAGLLSDGLDAIDPVNQLRVSAGAGFRYDTVIGPVRVDVSIRPRYPEDFGPVEDVGGPPRDYDLFSSLSSDNTGWRPPFALVYYLAIGDAL